MAQPNTTHTGQIVPRTKERDAGDELRVAINKMMPQIAMALPRHITPERLVRVAMTAITKTPKLAECHRGSFFACLLTAAQLGLEPNTPLGQGYLIPRWNKNLYGKGKGGNECTWQTGYQGMIDLAYRSGMVTGIRASLVRERDIFEWEEGLEPKLVHRPATDADRDKRPIKFAYAVVRIRNADPHFEVLPLAEIERRRQMNEAVKKGYFSPWEHHYGPMAKKTAISATLKYAPKSAELIRVEALEHGGAALTDAVDERIADALAGQGIALELPEPDTNPDAEPAPPDTAPSQGERRSMREEAEATGAVAPEDEPTDEELGGGR